MTVIRADPGKITKDRLAEWIENHNTRRYNILQDYYEARHNILGRRSADPSKPNNKIVNNYPGYIVDVNVGYFLGEPVAYTSQDETMMQDIQDIFDHNDEQDHNVRLGEEKSISGHAYELLYLDDQADIRFGKVSPANMFVIYDTKIIPDIIAAVRWWQEGDGKESTTYVELYTDREIVYYQKPPGQAMTEYARTGHPFGDVPVVEYLNNDQRQGDFEKVLSAIDAYDKAQSDTANDFEYFADAYLKIRNMSGTKEEDVAEMKKNRVILLDDDGDADWLIKQINDAAAENYKNRLQHDIHRFSKTPNLTDVQFGTQVTGIALRYKLWGLEQNAVTKERKMKKGLQRRIELICNVLAVKGKVYDWRDVQMTFTRNIPAVLPELANMVQQLKGIVSDKTLLAQLPFVEDPAGELEQLEEQDQGIDLDSIDLGTADEGDE